MKLAEGPALIAVSIGAGIGFLVLQKYGNVRLAVMAAGIISILNYAILIKLAQNKKKKK